MANSTAILSRAPGRPASRGKTAKVRSKSVRSDSEWANVRCRLYLLLSAGFRYASRESLGTMREDLRALKGMLAECSPADKIGVEGLASLREAVEKLGASVKGLSAEAFESEFLLVFTHVITSDCHPCETAYTATHLFQQAQMLADLNGFYRAFGVETNAERADHVSVEMEFMAFLIQKEAFAWSNDRPRRATLMRRTQRSFIEDHLGQWVRTFARFVEKKAEGGIYGALAALTREFIGLEFGHLGAEVRELSGPPTPLPLMMHKEQEDEDDDCPVFSTAEPKGVLGGCPSSGGCDTGNR